MPLAKGKFAVMADADGSSFVIQVGDVHGARGRRIDILGGRLARDQFAGSGYFQPDRFEVVEVSREEAFAIVRQWERERAIVARVLASATRTASKLDRRQPPPSKDA